MSTITQPTKEKCNDVFQKQIFDLSKMHEVIGEFELPQHLLGHTLPDMSLLEDGVRHKRTLSDLMLTNRGDIIQEIEVVKRLG